MNISDQFWKKCSSCKSEIPFKTKYYVCNVSTCNGKRTGLVFCSIPCFERHLPGARHKDAYAIEEISPARSNSIPTRRIISAKPESKNSTTTQHNLPKETLVVVSKLKDYIQKSSGMNTSASCMSILSDLIRVACDQAIDNARKDGRKTVLDRDFKK
ncbi:MAG: hypothetical protein KDD58_13795 [Bdellovibrionales bacterium]|nr:hypothetical protein [Bdellovibrionales bacterium]